MSVKPISLRKIKLYFNLFTALTMLVVFSQCNNGKNLAPPVDSSAVKGFTFSASGPLPELALKLRQVAIKNAQVRYQEMLKRNVLVIPADTFATHQDSGQLPSFVKEVILDYVRTKNGSGKHFSPSDQRPCRVGENEVRPLEIFVALQQAGMGQIKDDLQLGSKVPQPLLDDRWSKLLGYDPKSVSLNASINVWLDEIERDSKISPGIKRSFGVKTFSLNPNTSTFYFRNFKNNYVIDHSMTELSFQLKLPRCFMADQVRYIDFPQGATSVFEELKSVRNPFENLVGVVKIYFDPLSWSFLMSFLTQNSNISSLEIAFFEFNVIYFMNASDLQNIPHIKTLFVPLSNFIRHKDLFLVKFPNIQSLGIIDDIGTDWEQKRFRSQIEYFQAVNNLFEWIDKHQVKNLLIETSISEILLPRINSVLKNITTIVFQSPARYPLCQRDGLEPDAIDLSQLARLFPKAHHLWVRSSRVVGRYNNKNLLPTDWKQISLVQCSPLHKKAPLVELPRTIFPNLDEVKTYACGTFAIEARLNLANEKYDPLFFARALMDPNIITPLSPK